MMKKRKNNNIHWTRRKREKREREKRHKSKKNNWRKDSFRIKMRGWVNQNLSLNSICFWLLGRAHSTDLIWDIISIPSLFLHILTKNVKRIFQLNSLVFCRKWAGKVGNWIFNKRMTRWRFTSHKNLNFCKKNIISQSWRNVEDFSKKNRFPNICQHIKVRKFRKTSQ